MSTFNPFGAGTYNLGTSISSTATSIILSSFLEPVTATPYTMVLLNTDIAYGTIAPKTTQSEFISFTGITQNSDGTATLTGVVRGLAKKYPFTTDSTYKLPHSGQTQFIISDAPQVFQEYISLINDQTVTGVKTFSSFPVTPSSAPTTSYQVANKKYVDDTAVAGAPNASTTVKGIVQEATNAQVLSKTASGSTGAELYVNPATMASTLLSDYVVDTGAANAYVITPAPAVTAYTTGQIFTFKAVNTNTTASTLNVNALGVKSIKKLTGAIALVAGDITAGQIIQVEYDGTNFQMINPVASGIPAFTASQINEFLGTTDGTTLGFSRPFDYQSFTSSGTWTKPTNLSGNESVMVQLWGGGGGGGGAKASTAGAAGGGGGAFVETRFRASDLGSTVTVTIGAGGIAGVGATPTVGGAGGTTTFGSLLSAFGGGGGGDTDNGNVVSGGGGGGGAQSVGNPGALSSATGGTGGSPLGGAATTQSTFGGSGGASAGSDAPQAFMGGGGGAPQGKIGGAAFYGGAGGGGGSSGGSSSVGAGGATKTGFGGAGGAGGTATGVDGTAPGGGGGGGGTLANPGTSNGGAGAKGECRVWTFY